MISNKFNGVTLIELLVVLSILAITASFAVPSFKNLIKDRRIDDTSRYIHESIMFARSNAVKGDGGKLISGASNDWAKWEVRDSNDDKLLSFRSATNISVVANRTVIDAGGVSSSLAVDDVRFDSKGVLKLGASGTTINSLVFDICVTGDSSGRRIPVTALGVVSMEACVCVNEVCNP